MNTNARHPTNAMQAQIHRFFARAGTAHHKIQVSARKTLWPVRQVPREAWPAIEARARQVLSPEAIRIRASLELFDRLMRDVYGDV